MKNVVLGILAHVDAGKTTLTEGILLKTGVIKRLGRVDSGDAFLDNDAIERERGITIFSKQACFDTDHTHFDLLDTPGHVDFSAEMERALQVLDYAILVVSGADDIFGHTITLWQMLRQYKIPTFIFVNKMDRADKTREEILRVLKAELCDSCVDFKDNKLNEAVWEEIAALSADEAVIEAFLSDCSLPDAIIKKLIIDRKIFPVYFGSALKTEGIEYLLEGIDKYTEGTTGNEKCTGARVFKITRDSKGNRLTHVKVTSGQINVKDELFEGEKVNQIRIYNGEKYEAVNSVEAGRLCVLTGFENTYSGQGIGALTDTDLCLIEPVLEYDFIVPDGISVRQVYSDIKKLEEELPELRIIRNDETEQIKIKIMGQVQIEVLTRIIKDRFNFVPEFGTGRIAYKETVLSSAVGVGHFEPLRHYAEAHIKIEPNKRGQGITVSADCSEDKLGKNWQRLIMTHLAEKQHRGVLGGYPLTDVHLTVINGKAHTKHTEGGDFRQATYRAVRQGLMEASSVLLEPYYNFRLDIPLDMVGRAMTDIEKMHGTMNPPQTTTERAVITGYAPVYTMRDYQINVNAYTHGKGSLTVSFRGYEECHNQDDILFARGYNPDEDNYNPSSSVFCAHGSGYIVPWYDVKKYMHVQDAEEKEIEQISAPVKTADFSYTIDTEEIDSILNKTFNANSNTGKRAFTKKKAPAPVYKSSHTVNTKKDKLLIVDGYNVIFAWKELKELAEQNLDSAKDRLISILSNYQGISDTSIMLVFDGYKVKNGSGSNVTLENITVVYTKEDETADKYIEQFTKNNSSRYRITVVTSDGLIQLITRGHDCFILSSRDFEKLVNEALSDFREKYNL